MPPARRELGFLFTWSSSSSIREGEEGRAREKDEEWWEGRGGTVKGRERMDGKEERKDGIERREYDGR